MMKVISWVLMGLILLGCKRDKELTPNDISALVGEWRQLAYERDAGSGPEWVTVADTSHYNSIIIRADGVLLYGNGKGMCCAPSILNIGGRPFKIVPKSPVEYAEMCSYISCVTCESVEIALNQNEMIWTSCASYRARYERVP